MRPGGAASRLRGLVLPSNHHGWCALLLGLRRRSVWHTLYERRLTFSCVHAGSVLGHGHTNNQQGGAEAFDSSHNELLPRRVCGLAKWAVLQAASGGGHTLLACSRKELVAWPDEAAAPPTVGTDGGRSVNSATSVRSASRSIFASQQQDAIESKPALESTGVDERLISAASVHTSCRHNRLAEVELAFKQNIISPAHR